MCIALLRAAEERESYRSCGWPTSAERRSRSRCSSAFEATFGCAVLEGYGLTETWAPRRRMLGQGPKLGSVGTPVDGAEVRVVTDGGRPTSTRRDVGEVLVPRAGVMRGYWRAPEETRAVIDSDGWFATGDMGYLDADGYLFLVDRKKDVILRGGYTVYPREVEEVLYQHPAVREATVVGVPDETLGEEVVALVIARPGVDCDPADVKEFVRERVAAYKYPRLVVLVDNLPHGPSGKILKREIDRAPLRAALDSVH